MANEEMKSILTMAKRHSLPIDPWPGKPENAPPFFVQLAKAQAKGWITSEGKLTKTGEKLCVHLAIA